MKMLGKMLIHGLLAASIIGSAAAVYAQAKDNGYQASAATAVQRQDSAADAGNGYLRPTDGDVRHRGDRQHHEEGSERHRERHDCNHDDDDD